jgi:uncharacterized protein with HEPN domain
MTLADAASTKLSDGLRSRHPGIDWRAIRAFRNVAAHGYMELRLEPIRKIEGDDLDQLQAAVLAELVVLRREGAWIPPQLRDVPAEDPDPRS